jgi:hypothetical protein
MGIDEELRRLDEQRDAGELSEADYSSERARLLALAAPAAESPTNDVPPEQRWLSQQPAAWPTQAPLAPAAWPPAQPPQAHGAWPPAPAQQPWPQQPAPPPQQWQQPPAHAQWPQHGQQPGVPPAQPAPPGWTPHQQPGPQGWQQPWPQQQQPPQPGQWQAPPQQWAPQPQQQPWIPPQQQQHPMVAMYPGAQQYAPQMPPTYMLQAVLATMFCCMPMGIMAIVKASQVSSAWSMGDAATAQQRSNEARTWINWSVIGSLIFGAAYFVLILLAGIGGAI